MDAAKGHPTVRLYRHVDSGVRSLLRPIVPSLHLSQSAIMAHQSAAMIAISIFHRLPPFFGVPRTSRYITETLRRTECQAEREREDRTGVPYGQTDRLCASFRVRTQSDSTDRQTDTWRREFIQAGVINEIDRGVTRRRHANLSWDPFVDDY